MMPQKKSETDLREQNNFYSISSKNIPAHSKTNISRRQTLNHIDDMLDQTRKITSQNSLSYASSVLGLSKRGINNSQIQSQKRGSKTYINIMENLNKRDPKKRKKKRRRRNESSDEEEYKKKKPYLEMIEVQPMPKSNIPQSKSHIPQSKSRKQIQQQIDNFISSHQSISMNNFTKSFNSRTGDNDSYENEQDYSMTSSHRKKRKSRFNNITSIKEMNLINGKGSDRKAYCTSKDEMQGRESLNISKGQLGTQENEKDSLGQGVGQSDRLLTEQKDKDRYDQEENRQQKKNSENIYSFRPNKYPSGVSSQFDSQESQKIGSIGYPSEIDFFSQHNIKDDAQWSKMREKKTRDEFELIAESHPDYGINITKKKIGQMLYRIRNRIMVSMISIHHMKKQLPTTNQDQINVRYAKQTRQVKDVARLFTERPRWNSPKGFVIR